MQQYILQLCVKYKNNYRMKRTLVDFVSSCKSVCLLVILTPIDVAKITAFLLRNKFNSKFIVKII